ncbi:olfactory receptor-like protein OLF4 [Bufo gargarizans]|uniref:olfactory receptor-like protein OLF4 n=1 Tax=Bufo gargarizans TaxID=30331 RepID=UPI001CF534BC|nr:olfactory receptor-like protein OLF4 [Bufo gargarizans]
MENGTRVIDFYIIAFSKVFGQAFILFPTFLSLYLICLLWNMLIFVTLFMDPHLQKPMYFFLRNLSFVDVLYISVALPKLMDIIITENTRVSFAACFTQMYFFSSFACTEIWLLTMMSYDRYVAICFPLHYVLIMKKKKCDLMVAGCWLSGFCNSLFVTIFASRLSFCRSTYIKQIFCDIKTLTKISCGDIHEFQTMILVEAFLMGLCPFLLILMSYSNILANILGLSSIHQRRKTFSTCTSHLTILLMFYGTLLCMYMIPPSEYSEELDQIFSVFYLAVTPTLNPLIYSLRNKEVKNAIHNILFSNFFYKGISVCKGAL